MHKLSREKIVEELLFNAGSNRTKPFLLRHNAIISLWYWSIYSRYSLWLCLPPREHDLIQLSCTMFNCPIFAIKSLKKIVLYIYFINSRIVVKAPAVLYFFYLQEKFADSKVSFLMLYLSLSLSRKIQSTTCDWKGNESLPTFCHQMFLISLIAF